MLTIGEKEIHMNAFVAFDRPNNAATANLHTQEWRSEAWGGSTSKAETRREGKQRCGKGSWTPQMQMQDPPFLVLNVFHGVSNHGHRGLVAVSLTYSAGTGALTYVSDN